MSPLLYLQKLMGDGSLTMNLIFDNLEKKARFKTVCSLFGCLGNWKKESRVLTEWMQSLNEDGLVSRRLPVVRTGGEFFETVMSHIKFKGVSCSIL